MWPFKKKIDKDIEVGDRVYPIDDTLMTYFDRSARVIGVEKSKGPDGNKIKCDGHEGEYWSKYLKKV